MTEASAQRRGERNYWEHRLGFAYYQRVRALVEEFGRDAKSIVDVGTNGCPYLEWFAWIPRRVSVDLRNPYRSTAVEGVATDFMAWQPSELFDIALCMQVLEHVPDPDAFARKLLAAAPIVIVSVPYLWPVNSHRDHLHDMIDEETVARWFGRDADASILVTENRPQAGPKARRLICLYGVVFA